MTLFDDNLCLWMTLLRTISVFDDTFSVMTLCLLHFCALLAPLWWCSADDTLSRAAWIEMWSINRLLCFSLHTTQLKQPTAEEAIPQILLSPSLYLSISSTGYLKTISSFKRSYYLIGKQRPQGEHMSCAPFFKDGCLWPSENGFKERLVQQSRLWCLRQYHKIRNDVWPYSA